MTRILLALLAIYKRWLSPAVHSLGGGGCKFLPTCSEYAAMAIGTHGPLKGSALAAWRLLRCHPFSRGGLDLVPAKPTSAECSSAAAKAPAARTFPHEPLP